MSGSSERPTPQVNVVCRGSPEERGSTQGEALRPLIRACAAAIDELEAFRLRQPRWMPYRVYRRLAEHKADQFLGRALAAELPAARARLGKIAAASGLPRRTVALANAFEAVLSDLSASTTAAEFGCSAVAVGAQRSATGAPLLAHNFDYLPLVQPFYVLREERPAGGLRSLVFSVAPLCGAVDGLNEAGLAVSLNYAYATDPPRPAPTISMRLAQMLDTCRTVEEAILFLTSVPRWGGGLVMLADETSAASLELSNTHSHVRRAAASDVVYHTNAYCGDATRAVELPQAAVHGTLAPAALRGRRVHQSSERRNARFADRLGAGGRLGPDDLATLMADHGPDAAPSADSACMHSSYWMTTACVQALPAERRLRVAYDTACRATYVDFAL
jgi:hypothetical protein